MQSESFSICAVLLAKLFVVHGSEAGTVTHLHSAAVSPTKNTFGVGVGVGSGSVAGVTVVLEWFAVGEAPARGVRSSDSLAMWIAARY